MKFMIYLNFEDFINEKLGIRDDVVILSDFLYDVLKNKKKHFVINEKDIPKVSFKISKIVINFHSSNNVSAHFNERYSTLTKNGIEIWLSFNKDVELKKSTVTHELSHLIDHEIKLSKRIKQFKDKLLSSKLSNLFNEVKFNNLCQLIYLSDGSEMKAMIHQIYIILNDSFNNMIKMGYEKNKIFEALLIETGIKKTYQNMINYNIYDDLKNIPDKLKIKFFNDLINIDKKIYKIKKHPSISTIKLFFYHFFSKSNNVDLDTIMFQTQKHINDSGLVFRNKIHKLYGLMENKLKDE